MKKGEDVIATWFSPSEDNLQTKLIIIFSQQNYPVLLVSTDFGRGRFHWGIKILKKPLKLV